VTDDTTYIIRISGLAYAASVDEHAELWSAQKNVTGAAAVFAASSVASARLVAVTLHEDLIEHQLGHDLSVVKYTASPFTMTAVSFSVQ
jgi:hypothetical protein